MSSIVAKDVHEQPLPDDADLAESIKFGARILFDTQRYAPQNVGNALNCTNCHLNNGQQEGALPLSGIAAVFPEYSTRSGRVITLADSIRDCFDRSLNGRAPAFESKEVRAIASYITWISVGQPAGQNPAWRGKNRIAQAKLIAIEKLKPREGERLYFQKCAECHSQDGQGQGIIPPLWGPLSYNDGAGLASVYTLAGFLRLAMPHSAPGSLNDEEAQQLAAFIDSRERPAFAGKDHDYPGQQPPVDAVYYPRRYAKNPLRK